MHQIIDGKSVYVVEFDTMPELPITGLTEGEKPLHAYEDIVRKVAGPNLNGLLINTEKGITYAQALDHAISTGVITEGGKYGIYLVPGTYRYEIYRINEK